MCLVMFIGAHEPIEAVTIRSGDAVITISPERDEQISRVLERKHVAMVASAEGCACAFRGGIYEETEARLQHVGGLLRYLHSLGPDRKLRMMLCWDGDEGLAATDRGIANGRRLMEPLLFDEVTGAPQVYALVSPFDLPLPWT